MRVARPQAMKTLLKLLAGALLVGASVPVLATDPRVGAEAISDNVPRMASPGPYDDFIKQVQQTLADQRFYSGPVNGDFGPQTQAALAQFQLANLLPASGALDGATLLALGLDRPQVDEAGSAAAGSTAR